MGKNMALYDSSDTTQPFLGRNLATNNDKLSEYSKQEIDQEIESLVKWGYERALKILQYNYKEFIFLTQLLKYQRDLNYEDFKSRNIKFEIF